MKPGVAKLLFDECLPTTFVNKVAEFLGLIADGSAILRPLLEFAPSGTLDEVWIPQIKNEGWTVISTDGARKPNKRRGAQLPRLCTENGVTLIVLSPKVHNRKTMDKALTIISVWERIVEIATDPACRGHRFMLEPSDPANVGVGRITARPVRPRSNDGWEQASD